MPLEHPDFLNTNPYYDDFSEEKNFLRVLFKPGYAVQARELTQLQTILQSQISKFADHIFQEGSKVFGGNVTVSKLEFIRIEKNRVSSTGTPLVQETLIDDYLKTLEKNSGNEYVSNDNSNFYVGSLEHIEFEVFNPINGSYNLEQPNGTVRLVHYLPCNFSENDDYTILIVNTVSGSNILLKNSILKVKNLEIYVKITENSLVSSNGFANLISVQEGIYYSNGCFINNNRQNIVAYTVSKEGETEESLKNNILFSGVKSDVRLFEYSSNRIGFNVSKQSITVQDDITLRDPASGFYNANAPGADRYKIDLILTSLPLDPLSVDIENFANINFIQLVRINKGTLDWIQRLPNYSEILDLFARRTYDESGSYTVRPFVVELKEHLRKDIFEILIENSIDEPISPFYLQSGSFIWQNNGNVPAGFNPFNSELNLSNLPFPLGIIKKVIPLKETNQGDSSETGSLPSSSTIFNKKIMVQPVSSIRFNFTGNNQDFSYLKLAGSVQIISGRYLNFQLDGEGTYSLYDVPSGDLNKAVLSIQPGKAYVYGYEQDFYTTQKIEYLKGRDSNIDVASQNSFLSSSSFLGNYLIGNFIEKDLSLNTNEKINWEVLPKFELQSDDVFTLILKTSTTDQARGKIVGWSPFDRFSALPESRLMFGYTGPENDQEYESVIAIEEIDEET